MGLRESKLCFLAYEDAVKRVTEDELQRLRVAFKRASGVSGVMALATFAREVLGDGAPSKVAEQIYLAFGGTNKGLTFRDTLCGLVLLTRGTREEKIKFIFNIYSTDGLFVYKDQMEKIILTCDGGSIPRAVTECFSQYERLTFEEFSYWMPCHPDVMTIPRWLLSGGSSASVELTDNSETPTFYQTLARVTHLRELDIIELEKRYWTLKSSSKSGKFDLETFIPLISPPIPKCLCRGLFDVFDENGDSHIDFREMACGVSACCRGPNSERQRFCFKVFDSDGDGFLSRSELEVMCKALVKIKQENPIGEKDASSPLQKEVSLMVDEILSDCEKEKDGKINLDEYKEWATQHRVSQLFPKLLAQVCHIVLGLKPASREVELQVVRGWLERENQHEFQPSTIWYLVSISWWRNWREHVSYQPFIRRSSTSAIKKNGTLPNKTNQVDPGLRTRTLGRRESQPTYSQPGRASRTISPSTSMNGHVSTAVQGPGSIDNTPLIEPETRKVMILTSEGGRLKRNVMLSRGRDFEVVPEPVWRALQQWYQGGPALPRTVITPTNGDPSPELELYPVCLRLFRHAPPPTRAGVTTWTGVGLGLSGFGFGSNSVTAPHAPPKKYLAYLASFSRMNTIQQVFDYLCMRLRIRAEDMRLWDMEEENKLHLLEEDNSSLEKLGIKDNHALLIEVRNRDMSWPEEMSSLASSKSLREKLNQEPTEKGATGLSNLGNTCFMNSALQCLSNTQPLTQYFTSKCHLYEVNRTNPLGMKGHMARRYGDLVEDLWSGSSKSLAPLKLRWTVGRYAPRFSGFQQHDSQEFLSFLLDGLHEDLNRVHNKPYIELKDSDGRPDEVVAREAWDSHLKRNQSIMVDLFQGQLKSQVRCLECGNVSVRFDPFTFLSLPLPMDSSIYVEVVVIHLRGSTPTKYGLLLNQDDKYRAVKKELSKYCELPATNLLLVEVFGACIKSIPSDSQKIRSALGGNLYAYEIPMPAVNCEVHAPESPVTPSSGATTEQAELCSNQPEQARAAGAAESADPARDGDSKAEQKDNIQEARHVSNNLQVQDDWFSSGPNGKKASPEKKRSPKLRGGLNARLGNAFNFNGHARKPSSSSNESSQNLDHGSLSLGNNKLAQNKLTVVGEKSPAANSGVSSPSASPVSGPSAQVSCHFVGFVVAVHRKMIRMDAYFLSPQKNRPSLFGLPVIVPCTAKTKKSELYRAVWTQVTRLLSPAPPGDGSCKEGEPGNYPFELRVVQRDGVTCAWCPWYRFCRGCVIECNEEELGSSSSSYVAIEWDPTTLHLRYQSSLEKACTEHESVERSRRLQTEPIDLYECLRAFTKEEELGEDELWFCNKCKKHQLAVKKLEIWSLPPILVIHLKRFQFVNGHWVKSNKIVNFPMEGFDPSAFLVKRSRTNIRSMLRTSVITVTVRSSDDEPSAAEEPSISGSDQSDSVSQETKSTGGWVSSSEVDVNPGSPQISPHSSSTSLNSARVHPEGTASDSKSLASVECIPSEDTGHHDGTDKGSGNETKQKAEGAEKTAAGPPTYRLYAMSCHTGVLAGGHYISYAHNPNNRWYLYNDSSCKECDRSKMQKDSPYMLFYQRDNLLPQSFLPKVWDRTPDSGSDDEDYESDVRRLCAIQ